VILDATAMNPGRGSSDSGGGISSQPTSFTIESGARQRLIRGHLQMLRNSNISIVNLLHLVPTSRVEMADLRLDAEQKDRPHSRINFLKIDESDDGISIGSVALRQNAAVKNDSEEGTLSTISTKLIVKSFKDEVFYDIEVEAYRRMGNIQGTVVPEFYGAGMLNDLPTIVLEHISGDDLYSYRSNINRLPALARAVEECSRLVAECGVAQMDPRLDGIIVTSSSGSTDVLCMNYKH
jgi:hypothetical protein